MRILTKQDLLTAARKAYRDGTLTAQAPTEVERTCIYADINGRHCAIGCALTEDEIAVVLRDEKANTMRCDHHIFTDLNVVAFEDPNFAVYLQDAHDKWCFYATDDPDIETDEERAFRKLIGF